MNLRDIARLIDRRFDHYIPESHYCGTQSVGEIMWIVKFRWNEFSEQDKQFIKSILSVDDSYDPPLVNL